MKTEYSFDNETWYDAPEGKAFVPGIGEIHLRMSNETTATQPKVAAPIATILYSKDFQELIESITGIDLAEECDESSDMVKALRELISVIDNFRAPADQASATIQAAPRTSFADYWWEARHERRTQEDHAKAAWDFALKSAAAIQEPVMVAEPGLRHSAAARKHVERIDDMHKGVVGVFAAIKAEHEAAPMVAEPAGVVLQTAAALLRPLVQDGVEVRIKHARPVLAAIDKALAATVKAVPSEARLAKQVRADEWRAVAAYLESQQGLPPEEMKTVRLCATVVRKVAQSHLFDFAAPLADKTGGGE